MINMKQDVLDVVDYMKKNYTIGQISAFGYSMGGRTLLELVADEKIQPEKAAEVVKGKALVIYATDYPAVDPQVSQEVANALHCPAVVVNGCGHKYSFYGTDPEMNKMLNDTMRDFLIIDSEE